MPQFPSPPLESQVFQATKQLGGAGAVQAEQLLDKRHIELQYKYTDGEFTPHGIRVKFNNACDHSLFVSVLYFSSKFGMQPLPMIMRTFQTKHGETSREILFQHEITGGASAYLLSGNPLNPELRADYAAAGITEAKDILKVIYSTHAFDIKKYQVQKGLSLPALNTRSSEQSRGIFDEFDDDELNFLPPDWDTEEIPYQNSSAFGFQAIHLEYCCRISSRKAHCQAS